MLREPRKAKRDETGWHQRSSPSDRLPPRGRARIARRKDGTPRATHNILENLKKCQKSRQASAGRASLPTGLSGGQRRHWRRQDQRLSTPEPARERPLRVAPQGPARGIFICICNGIRSFFGAGDGGGRAREPPRGAVLQNASLRKEKRRAPPHPGRSVALLWASTARQRAARHPERTHARQDKGFCARRFRLPEDFGARRGAAESGRAGQRDAPKASREGPFQVQGTPETPEKARRKGTG